MTHLSREPIDHVRAVEQHAAYERCLERLGCRVVRLADAPDLPDSVFVEDAAIVFADLAVIARPGAASRRPEVDAMAEALRPHRPLAFIQSPGTLDGGDVLVASCPQRAGTRVGGPGGQVFVGISGRTNEDGVRQLAAFLGPQGFDVIAVPVTGCLHLKSAVTQACDGVLVVNPEWVDVSHFEGFELIEVDPSEPAAANVLRIGAHVICAEEHPKTRQRLAARGLDTQSVPAGELAKAEGGVTCCSVLVPPPLGEREALQSFVSL